MSNALPRFIPDKPVLIAGPTASGKSDLALRFAEEQGRHIVNADALQVYDGWHILTARPSEVDMSRACHWLYGHVSYRDDYSVGQWLRDLRPHLHRSPAPVIVGGTGLYFMALTEGLAEIPTTEPLIRQRAADYLAAYGLSQMVADLDTRTRGRLDTNNPMRVQRAWEVKYQTGRELADWQDDTPPPLVDENHAHCFVVQSDADWLNARIDLRFDRMLELGALEEARRMEPDWDSTRLSSNAIGATELIEVIRETMSLEQATKLAKIASHQYAKRQRTWFRKRMKGWNPLNSADFTPS
ncbi:tRNA (adenosine(37)-N6)-dimethylallyltransferase MiaA [Qingshengfaniella alkalisoli]|uniref:tRNA dimethylallyltransferase n=1 Tax=Qingshengfaniella alkalisoli TaxID=2599296 RepID=A0A5B8IXK4_9RHOB|nr:tRNA (adenosine(37)-N6)-dimethylallyltransferase MiaA [Qingshengfaniella alkalisoli]QDY69338.1 tRNA (adenosine(37)-N6)-dimethylallyltransferase MiaA [Qingshengfaniella alkalisoli]